MKKVGLLFCVIFLTAVCVIPASARIIATKQRPYTVRSTQPPTHITAAKLPPGKHVFYSNFFNNPNEPYQANGFLILGPLNIDFGGATQWEAQSFIPTTGGTVNEIDVPLQSYASFGNPGDNQQNVSINADDGSGNPGAVIYQKTMKNLPVFPACCSSAAVHIPLLKQPVITAGTQYWIVVTTNTTGKGANTEGVWMFTGSSTNEFNQGTGWIGPSQQFGTNAFAVLGHL
jgi:hypothetical protein